MSYWCENALVDNRFVPRLRIESSPHGIIDAVQVGVDPRPGDEMLSTVVPGFANTHSHAFHRALRGQTNSGGGDFWVWRERMYAVASRLDPENYRVLATAVFGEMLAAGYTAVGEFHYVHHRPGPTPFSDHAMELALAEAAAAAGIRLTLLDTCYLTGGIGEPLAANQRGFSDGSAERWIGRWFELRGRLQRYPGVILGAAIHSVRAVDPDSMATIGRLLPDDVPLHVHLSEQPQENIDCERAYGVTPTQLLSANGLLSARTTVVHATHLTPEDIETLGSAAVSVSICPSTESDLGDGLGHAYRLSAAGARVTVGSDQNVLIDPLIELRSVEAHERLARGSRGVFTPAELWTMGTESGYRSLGWDSDKPAQSIAVGAWCDLVEIDARSIRTSGALLEELMFAADAADITRTIVGGRAMPPVAPSAMSSALSGLSALDQ